MLRLRWHDVYSHADPDDKGPVIRFLKGITLIQESEMPCTVNVAQKPVQEKNMAHTVVDDYVISHGCPSLIETGNKPKVQPEFIILEDDSCDEEPVQRPTTYGGRHITRYLLCDSVAVLRKFIRHEGSSNCMLSQHQISLHS